MLQFNGYDLTQCYLTIPKQGRPVATVSMPSIIASTLTLGVVGNLVIDDISWKMVINSVIPLGGTTKLTLVGGTSIPGTGLVIEEARNYTNIDGNKIITDLVERYADLDFGTVEENVKNYQTAYYQLLANINVGRQLTKYLDRFSTLGMMWKVNNEGKVDIISESELGTSSIPERNTVVDVFNDGSVYCSVEVLTEMPVPGSVISIPDSGIEDQVYNEVTLNATSYGSYITLYKNGLNSFITVDDLESEVKYTRGYLCTVVQQNNNGTLKLSSEDQEIQGLGLDNIPVAHLPGVTITGIDKGVRCMLHFENGHPSRPYVSAFSNPQSGSYGSGHGTAYIFGDKTSSGYVALASPTDSELDHLYSSLAKLGAAPITLQNIVTQVEAMRTQFMLDPTHSSVASKRLKTE